jgi:hypothetical protein
VWGSALPPAAENAAALRAPSLHPVSPRSAAPTYLRMRLLERQEVERLGKEMAKARGRTLLPATADEHVSGLGQSCQRALYRAHENCTLRHC